MFMLWESHLTQVLNKFPLCGRNTYNLNIYILHEKELFVNIIYIIQFVFCIRMFLRRVTLLLRKCYDKIISDSSTNVWEWVILHGGLRENVFSRCKGEAQCFGPEIEKKGAEEGKKIWMITPMIALEQKEI